MGERKIEWKLSGEKVRGEQHKTGSSEVNSFQTQSSGDVSTHLIVRVRNSSFLFSFPLFHFFLLANLGIAFSFFFLRVYILRTFSTLPFTGILQRPIVLGWEVILERCRAISWVHFIFFQRSCCIDDKYERSCTSVVQDVSRAFSFLLVPSSSENTHAHTNNNEK